MNPIIQETAVTPSVYIIDEEHRIVISGPCRLEDPAPFFEKISTILDDHLKKFKRKIYLDFHISYINSGSSKWLLHILKNMQTRFRDKNVMTVSWYHDRDDETMLEAGEIFRDLVKLPFKILANET